MTSDLGNGAQIATLLGGDGTSIVGHLFLWDSGDLGILWTRDDHEISFIDRTLDVDILAPAQAANSAEIVEFLETLEIRTS